MDYDIEKISENFLEIASEQRLSIILNLLEKKYSISEMAKKIDATTPEVHRNFTRLSKSGIIAKNSDREFELTLYGKSICALMPNIEFMNKNLKFFENHDFGDLPQKFIQRIGALKEYSHIKGFVRVIEKWRDIHDNSSKFICNILAEVPYDSDIVNIIEGKLKKKIHIKSVFSEDAVIPEERKKVFDKKNFANFVKQGTLQRRMIKKASIGIVLNEKEAGIIFPKIEGTPDMEHMLYSKDDLFHEWCLDYFEFIWHNSSSFQENKLQK